MKIISFIKQQISQSKLSFRQLKRTDPNILVFIVYGLLYDIVINLYKPFAIKFLDRIDGNEFHISLYNSLPGFAAIFALLPGALIIGRFARKKGITTMFFSLSRVFILMLAFVPFLPDTVKPMSFVLLISSMNFFDAVSQCSLQSFLGTTFNGFTRARAISLRNKFGNFFVLVITLATGLIITYVPGNNDSLRMKLYQIFFSLSFGFGILEIIIFNRFKEKHEETSEEANEKPGFGSIVAALRDKKFMKFLLPTVFLYFTWQAGWPLSSIIQIKNLHADEMWLAFFAVASGLASFFAASHWAKIIVKKGNDFALIIAAVAMSANMVLFAVCPNLPVMILVSVFGGLFTIGMSTTLLNGLLISTPDKNRVVYIGVYNTFINITLAVSPYLSYLLFEKMTARPAISVIAALRLLAAGILLLCFISSRKKNKVSTKTNQ